MQAAARRLIIAVGANPRSEEYENIFFIVAATRRHKIAGGVVGYDKNPRNIVIAVGANPRNSKTQNTKPTEHESHRIFYIDKKSVAYFTGIKNLRFTSPPILCHHFVVAFVIIIVAAMRRLTFILFSVGLHPRRNSNTTSVVFSDIIEKQSTAMQTFFLVKTIPSTVSKKHQKNPQKNLEKVKKSPYLCTRK